MEGSATILLELGAVVIGLAILARAAGRIGIPPIPLYLIAGLAFGEGGLLPLVTTEAFIRVGAEIGLIMLLFMLGLEHPARELVTTLRASARAGAADLVLNFAPGFIAGWILGWSLVPSLFLGGITYVSSSGIAAKLMSGPGPRSPAAPLVVSILVLEDLAMAVMLPLLGGLVITDAGRAGPLLTAGVAVAAVLVLLVLAMRVDVGISKMIFSHSDEALLLTIIGFALVVAGLAELVQVSAAVGALLAGIALSGPATRGAKPLLSPVRDLFAAIFFAFVGFSVDPTQVPPFLLPAAGLGLITAATKLGTTWWSGGRRGLSAGERVLAGALLISRGEFSLAIAALGVATAVEPDLGPFAIAYILVLAITGPLVVRVVERRVPV